MSSKAKIEKEEDAFVSIVVEWLWRSVKERAAKVITEKKPPVRTRG